MRRKKIIKINSINKKKLIAFLVIYFVLFILLIIRIGFLQLVQGSELKERAIKNQLSSKTIDPNRGSIYDTTGKALAISARVDNVSINPTKIDYEIVLQQL